MESINLQDEEILSYYLQFIYQIASSLETPSVSCDDLCQEGYLALIEAQEAYKESLHISFLEYAISVIKSKMLDFINRENEYFEIKQIKTEEYINKENSKDTFENLHLHYDLFRCLSQARLSPNGLKMVLMSYEFVGNFTMQEKAEELHVQLESVPAIERRAMEKIRLKCAKYILDYADNFMIAQQQLDKARQNKCKVMFRGRL